jgi:nucleoside-diphosphate-sugar epimerase
VKILITGHRGFVGRHYHRALENHDLTLIDILDGNDARDFFRQNETTYDLVIHLAAVVGGRQMIERQPLALAVDLAIDAEMATWALRTRPRQIIYFSSSAAYPTELQDGKERRWLSEWDIHLMAIKSPDMSYGWAKLSGEMLCNYLREAGLSVLVFRPFSGYGADQSLDYPFPSLIKRGLELQDPFIVWGSLGTVRDWIHIDDIIEASLLLAAHRLSVTVNLSTGRATSFEDLAAIICAQMGYKPEFKAIADQPKGVSYRVGNPTLLHSLGYIPKISIEDGVSRALAVGRAR